MEYITVRLPVCQKTIVPVYYNIDQKKNGYNHIHITSSESQTKKQKKHNQPQCTLKISILLCVIEKGKKKEQTIQEKKTFFLVGITASINNVLEAFFFFFVYIPLLTFL
ncbi:hypothetical protein STCU_11427 [Strigomonas culicis]|uniref:Uncharacterized protein n=1 Tax=Strigomonas culicis TaxID=28005 RepID=S9TIT3_9TRYP|nr:hypothetical protein STCU_11427 [Strigomonas culicis]|eukprot:EPY16283.1 hypothetical protein STCU_11427 [Strigomonas culicis]